MKIESLLQTTPHKPEKISAGILRKEDSKKLEIAVISRLREIGHRFTTKEIADLMSTINTSKNLSTLKENLSKHTNLQNSPDITREVLALAKQIQSASVEELAILKNMVTPTLVEMEAYIKNGTFAFENTDLGKKLENSPLGKNIFLDAIGIGVGIAESLLALLNYILELVLHPIASVQEKMTQKVTRSE